MDNPDHISEGLKNVLGYNTLMRIQDPGSMITYLVVVIVGTLKVVLVAVVSCSTPKVQIINHISLCAAWQWRTRCTTVFPPQLNTNTPVILLPL
jgi:hypothetical protein